MKKLFLAALLTTMSWFTQAAVTTENPAAVSTSNQAIEAALEKMKITHYEISNSPIPGLKLIAADNNLFYITDNGQYLIHGSIFDLSSPMVTNLTFQYLGQRMEAMKDDMIIYPAKNEKHVITVFTDITCGYCRKLHEELQSFNDLGISVRYLAFPRAGLDNQTAKDMQSIWCMTDRRKALDAAIKGEAISAATCKTNIKKQFDLGLQFGIQGTPAMVLGNGVLIPGYQNAKDTLAILENTGKNPPTTGASKTVEQ